MFSFDGHLVQVEMGTAALQRYSSKDTRGLWKKLVGEPPPGWGDDLIRETSQLQAKLQGEGVYLPGVLFSPAQELPANCVRITFGVSSTDFDANQLHPINVLDHLARKYQPPAELTENWVLDQLFIALNHIQRREFQEAMNKLALVYYWGSLIDYPTVRVVALLNIGGLLLINSRPDDAYTSIRQAQFIVEKKDFHDPYLRFYTREALADIAYARGDFQASGALHLQAADTIRPLGEEYFLLSALHQSIVPLMEAGEYKVCVKVLEEVVSLVSNADEDYGNTFWAALYHLRSDLADKTEEELLERKEQLQGQVLELQTRYDKLAQKKEALGKLAVAVIHLGGSVIQYYMGALNSGDKYYDQHIQNHLKVGQAEQLIITQISKTGSNHIS